MATPQVASSGLEGRCCQAASLGQDGVQREGAICVFLQAGTASRQGLCKGPQEGLPGGRSEQGSSNTRLNDLGAL